MDIINLDFRLAFILISWKLWSILLFIDGRILRAKQIFVDRGLGITANLN